MTMDIHEAAKELDGSEYGDEGSPELFARMADAGLVAVFGASDDLMEFRGAIDDESDPEAWLTPAGFLARCRDECAHYRAALERARKIEGLFDEEEGENAPAWTYETEIPHATFMVYEDGEPWCRGIVFRLGDVAA